MKATCSNCNTEYNIDDARIPPEGLRIRCPECMEYFVAKREAGADAAAPPPAPVGRAPVAPPVAGAPGAGAPGSGGFQFADDDMIALPDLDQAQASTPPPPPGGANRGVGDGFGALDLGSEDSFDQPTPAAETPGESGATANADYGNIDFSDALPPSVPKAPKASTMPPPPAAARPLAGKPSGGRSSLPPAPGSPPPTRSVPGAGARPPAPRKDPAPGDSLDLDEGTDDFSSSVPPALNRPPAAAPAREQTDPKAAGKPAAGARYRVRTFSGKVHGPLDQRTVIRMLQAGELRGTEEVSEDGIAWVPMGDVEAFREAFRKLEDEVIDFKEFEETVDVLGPLGSRPAPAPEEPKSHAHQSRPPRAVGKKPFVIAAVVLVVVSLGASLGLTEYGAFGVRAISGLLGRLSSGSSELGSEARTEVARALDRMARDTFAFHQEGIAILEGLLGREPSNPTVRSLLCFSYLEMTRRYGVEEKYRDRATEIVTGLEQSHEDLPEFLLCGADAAIVKQDRAGAASRIDRLLRRRPSDREALWLQVQTRLAEKDWTAAEQTLDVIAQAYAAQQSVPSGTPAAPPPTPTPVPTPTPAAPDSAAPAGTEPVAATALPPPTVLAIPSSPPPEPARLRHARAVIALGKGDTSAAEALLLSGLAADPLHLASALLLGEVYEDQTKDQAKARAALDLVVGPDSRHASPTEQAEAYSRLGRIASAFGAYDIAVADIQEAVKRVPRNWRYLVTLGDVHLAHNHFDEAIEAYRLATDANKTEAQPVLRLARAHEAIGTLGEVFGPLQDLLRAAPSEAGIPYFLGRIEELKEDRVKAEAQYRRALDLDATSADARVALASLLAGKGDLTGALDLVTAALRDTPDAPVVYLGLGALQLAQSNPAVAETEFRRGLEKAPGDLLMQVGIGDAQLAANRAEDAVASYTEVARINPRQPGIQLKLGLALLRLKRHDDASAHFEEARRQDIKNPYVYLYLGQAYLGKGDAKGAQGFLNNALVLKDDEPEVHYYMGLAMEAQQKLDQAVAFFKTAVTKAPRIARYHYHLGRAYYLSGTIMDARDELRIAIELAPQEAPPHETLARVLRDQGQIAQAIEHFLTAVKLDPALTPLWLDIGDAYMQEMRPERAIESYKKLLLTQPDSAETYHRMGLALEAADRREQSIPYFAKAAALAPQNPEPHRYLGFAYKEQRQPRRALDEFEKYLQLRPDAVDARDIRDEIRDIKEELGIR